MLQAGEKTALLLPTCAEVECAAGAPRRSHWRHTLLLLVASVMGVGVLGLPLAFEQLGGWLGGTLLVLLFSAGSAYTGTLLSRTVLATTVAGASAPQTYADLGARVYGRRGRKAVQVVAGCYLFGTCASVLLTAALSLVQVVGAVAGEGAAPQLCLPWAVAAVCALVLPLLQVRTLHELAWTAAAGIAFIAAPIILVLAVLATMVPLPPAAAPPPPAASSALWGASVGTAMADIMFATSGQVIFVELQAEMRQPADFPRAVLWSSGANAAVYLGVALAGEHFLGSAVQAPVTVAMPVVTHAQRVAKGVANLLLLLHVLVSFVIKAVVVNRAVLCVAVPTRWQHRKLAWLIVTLATLGCWFVVANAVPFLQDLMGLMGATGGMALAYFFPIAFARKVLCGAMSAPERRVLSAVLVLAALACVVATLSVLANTIEHMAALRAPFSCDV